MNTIKFCAKCGAPIGPEEKFCGGCGASIAEMEAEAGISTQQAAPAQAPVQQAQPVQQQAPQYDQQYAQPANNYTQAAAPAAAKPNPFAKLGEWVKDHKKITLIAAAALIVVIVAIIILCNILKYQVIDAKDLFKFEFKGIDGCGYVEAELNCYDKSYYSMADATSALGDLADETDLDLGDLDDLSDYASSSDKSSKVSKYFALDKKTLTKAFNKADDFTEAKKMRNALLKTNSDGEYKLKITFDKKANKNLKNGDKVKCTVKYNEDSLKDKNIKLKNTEFEVTVKDLKKGEEIDFFKGVEVKFSGFDGNGSADVSYDSAYPFIYYDYDHKSDLKNGDKYTVTANIDVYGAEESGDMTWFEYDDKYYTYKTADVKDGKVTKDFTVEGLEKTQEIDPFEGLEFECSGGVPFVKPYSVKSESIPAALKDNVSYSVSCDDYIGIGGTFKVTCSPYSSLARNGITLSGKTETNDWGDTVYVKEITVDETFPAYVTADNGKAAMDSYQSYIDDKIEDMRKDIKDHYAPYPADFDGKVTSIESFDYVDTYVAFTNKKNYDSWENTNSLYNLYKITVKTDKEKKAVSFYASIYCSNIVATGETFTDKPYFSTSYYNKEADFKKKVIEAEGYTTTKAGAASKPATDDSSSAAASEATTTTTTTAKTDSSVAETTTSAKDKATTTTLVP